ncbi:unnamed protein product [Parnassius apollo]|uniref:(apollo) hypothetical protein n=1 Tax=Parnassius apollo TaxID=110799 RepID=A0A8S3WCP7_PARAO|nr:unnamed protein product [Parnassius apollo]
MAKQSNEGMVVLNWRDKRDVRMLTTKTSALEMVPNNSRNTKAMHTKPKCIADYNKGAADTYKSKWFTYDEFAFMADKNDSGTTRDTLQQEESNSTTGSGEHAINENALENVDNHTTENVNNQMQDMNDQCIRTEPSVPSEQPAAQSNVQNTQHNVQTQKRNQNKRRKKNIFTWFRRYYDNR